jgi:hypothetical protein
LPNHFWPFLGPGLGKFSHSQAGFSINSMAFDTVTFTVHLRCACSRTFLPPIYRPHPPPWCSASQEHEHSAEHLHSGHPHPPNGNGLALTLRKQVRAPGLGSFWKPPMAAGSENWGRHQIVLNRHHLEFHSALAQMRLPRGPGPGGSRSGGRWAHRFGTSWH